jgi:hypothetical protein
VVELEIHLIEGHGSICQQDRHHCLILVLQHVACQIRSQPGTNPVAADEGATRGVDAPEKMELSR